MNGGMVIVGAGECGVRAALTLREAGFSGPVTLIGAERHAPYERPPLSKDLMYGEPGVLPRTIASAERLAAAGVEFQSSSVVSFIDPAGRSVNTTAGAVIGYDRLLLATGASPRQLSLPRAHGPRFVTLRSYDDAVALRAALVAGTHLVVIGGGFIGLELAAAASAHGASVTVVEALPRLLSRAVPAELAAQLEARHRTGGVEIICGASLVRIEDTATTTQLHLGDGQMREADLVVVGIGSVPETALAAGAGLRIDNGIAVDHFLRTSEPRIFAAGDCCSFPLDLYGGRRVRLESWRNAQEQGTLAALNMLGADEPITTVPWFWSDQYDLVLQIVGLQDEGRSIVARDVEAGRILFHLADDGRLVAASGLGEGNTVARDIRLAEMLIARRARPKPQDLASPQVGLKALLRESA